MKILVLGGTGLISKNIVSHLLKRGDKVVVANRGKRSSEFTGEVELVQVDRKDHNAFRTAFESRRFDAVIDMICFFKEDAEQTLDVFARSTDHIIICSTVAAYKRPYHTIPTREDYEELLDNPAYYYAFHKAEMERYLWEQLRSYGLPITVVRPSLTFGKGASNMGTLRQNYNIVHRIQNGKPLVLFGDGHHPWSFSFAPDVGRAIASLTGKRDAIGEAFHVTSEERSEWKDLYIEMGKILGKEPQLVSVPTGLLYEIFPDFCSHLFFEKSHSGLFDNSKRIELTGEDGKFHHNLRSGLELVIDSWYQAGARVDKHKDEIEDELARGYEELKGRLSSLSGKL